MLCARALVRTLNDAKNHAQQGCAMQFNGNTLTVLKHWLLGILGFAHDVFSITTTEK